MKVENPLWIQNFKQCWHIEECPTVGCNNCGRGKEAVQLSYLLPKIGVLTEIRQIGLEGLDIEEISLTINNVQLLARCHKADSGSLSPVDAFFPLKLGSEEGSYGLLLQDKNITVALHVAVNPPWERHVVWLTMRTITLGELK